MLLAAGKARARVDLEAGGRLASLEVAGLELLVTRPESAGSAVDPMRWGCYPMAPWAGRVREGGFEYAGTRHRLPLCAQPHAIHGTVHRRTWRDDGAGVLSTDLGPDWPFAGRAVQRISLTPDALELRLEVLADAGSFPASLGWHPWFRRRLARGGAAELRIEARSMYRRDAAGIPTGERIPPPPGPWDDCFTDLDAPPRIRWPGALELTLRASVDHWVVYDEPEHALCVEPQTGPPDALNLAPRIVEPGSPLVAEARLEWVLE